MWSCLSCDSLHFTCTIIEWLIFSSSRSSSLLPGLKCVCMHARERPEEARMRQGEARMKPNLCVPSCVPSPSFRASPGGMRWASLRLRLQALSPVSADTQPLTRRAHASGAPYLIASRIPPGRIVRCCIVFFWLLFLLLFMLLFCSFFSCSCFLVVLVAC